MHYNVNLGDKDNYISKYGKKHGKDVVPKNFYSSNFIWKTVKYTDETGKTKSIKVIPIEDYNNYMGNKIPYTQGIYNYYDTDGVAGISKEELKNIRDDIDQINRPSNRQMQKEKSKQESKSCKTKSKSKNSSPELNYWGHAIDLLVDNKRINKFSYIDIRDTAELLEEVSDGKNEKILKYKNFLSHFDYLKFLDHNINLLKEFAEGEIDTSSIFDSSKLLGKLF